MALKINIFTVQYSFGWEGAVAKQSTLCMLLIMWIILSYRARYPIRLLVTGGTLANPFIPRPTCLSEKHSAMPYLLHEDYSITCLHPEYDSTNEIGDGKYFNFCHKSFCTCTTCIFWVLAQHSLLFSAICIICLKLSNGHPKSEQK